MAKDLSKKLVIGADHAGYRYKEMIKSHLKENGYSIEDIGTHSEESVDYPDFAKEVARRVSSGEIERGILICGTGIGVSITANKFPGVRAAVCHDVFTAKASRAHNDANVLALGARVLKPEEVIAITDVWLKTEFEGGRHVKRVQKIEKANKT